MSCDVNCDHPGMKFPENLGSSTQKGFGVFLVHRRRKGELTSEQRCPMQSVKVQLLGYSNRRKGHHMYDSYAELQDFK